MHNVCLAFTDPNGMYALFAATTLLSMLENTREPVAVHIFHDATLQERGHRVLERTAEKYGSPIIFHHITRTMLEKLSIKNFNVFTVGALYRYFIPELVPHETVLYTDCDIVFTLDVKEVFEAAQEKSFHVGVVQDVGVYSIEAIRKSIMEFGLDYRTYFNSGVMLFNNERLNSTFHSFSKIMISISNRMQNTYYIDQHALNTVFRKYSKLWLDEKFNYMLGINNRFYMDKEALAGKILHYTCRKPWCDTSLPASKIFYEYFSRVCTQD